MLTTGNGIFDIGIPILVTFVVLWLFYVNPSPAKGLQFPPGPTPRISLGNFGIMKQFYFPPVHEQWKRQYGELMSINVLGRRIVVVNSLEVARDLFEKRSKIYSGRPTQPILEMLGWTKSMGAMTYGDLWRRHRRTFHQYFNNHAVDQHAEIQLEAVRDLAYRLYEAPEAFEDHIRHYAAMIIMKVVYGYELKRKEDPYVDIVKTALEGVGEAMNPGLYAVDFLHFLRYAPSWMPGASWKKKLGTYQKPTRELATMPLEWVKTGMSEGKSTPSMTSIALSKLYGSPVWTKEDEDVITYTAGIAYGAGAGTSLGGLMTIILAIVMHPEVQRKAQEELDRVLGDRLPTMEDMQNLPYVNAFCAETQRWRPVLPFGVAHATTEDDVYGDYFIPKGSIVIGNAWTILMDEKVYGPDVDKFKPERFLQPGSTPPIGQFGFGRRICPGRYLAERTLFIAAATILKLFDITPAKDEQGHEIPIPGDYVQAAIVIPLPFRCSIKPRSAAAEKLILEANSIRNVS